MKTLGKLRRTARTLLPGVLFLTCSAGWAQAYQQNFPRGGQPGGSIPPMDPMNRNHNDDPFTQLNPRMEHLRQEREATDRLNRLRSDSTRLVELCNQLNASLGDHPSAPTDADRKLMQQIEGLLRDIRSKMTQ